MLFRSPHSGPETKGRGPSTAEDHPRRPSDPFTRSSSSQTDATSERGTLEQHARVSIIPVAGKEGDIRELSLVQNRRSVALRAVQLRWSRRTTASCAATLRKLVSNSSRFEQPSRTAETSSSQARSVAYATEWAEAYEPRRFPRAVALLPSGASDAMMVEMMRLVSLRRRFACESCLRLTKGCKGSGQPQGSATQEVRGLTVKQGAGEHVTREKLDPASNDLGS